MSAGASTATYAYLPGSPLIQSVTVAQGGATRLTATRAYDQLNRLTSISSQPSAPGPPLSYAYAYNAANQRTRATREDNTSWAYTYDSLGQVTSGRKLDAAQSILPGHDFAWTYDDIGNRKTETRNARSSTYAATLLNTYASRTVPGGFDLLAAAAPGATVTYTYPADSGAPTALPRVGDFLFQQIAVDNATHGVEADVKVTGVKNNAGPAGEDAVTEITRGLYVPQTPEVFSYDADGNLTGDGRWTYTWDGENRLVDRSRGSGCVVCDRSVANGELTAMGWREVRERGGVAACPARCVLNRRTAATT